MDDKVEDFQDDNYCNKSVKCAIFENDMYLLCNEMRIHISSSNFSYVYLHFVIGIHSSYQFLHIEKY